MLTAIGIFFKTLILNEPKILSDLKISLYKKNIDCALL